MYQLAVMSTGLTKNNNANGRTSRSNYGQLELANALLTQISFQLEVSNYHFIT